MSPAVRSVLGYNQEEALAASLRRLVHPDDLSRVLAATRSLGPGRPHASATHRIRHRDGHWLWMEAAYRLSGGEDAMVVASLRDVTARQQAAGELEAAKAEAEAAAKVKSDFLATMSREIRTPLNGIIGFTGLVLDRSDLPPDLRCQVRLVLTAGTSLLTVVNDVLDLSKIEADRIALDPRPFAMESLVENTASLVRGAAEAKGLAFAVEVGPDIPAWLVGDEHRLRQVLLNFLNNPVKFTQRGRVSLRVSRDGEDAPGGARLRFAVSDTGIGIPQASQGRLLALLADGRLDQPRVRRHGAGACHLQTPGRADGRHGRHREQPRPGFEVLVRSDAAARSAPLRRSGRGRWSARRRAVPAASWLWTTRQ